MTKEYDAIVIGSGQGGKPLAQAFAKKGKTTLLIEKAEIGGTCINRGCTPTKTMIASGKVAFQMERSSLFGIEGKIEKIDLAKIIARKNKIVESFRSSSQKKIEETKNLDLIFGKASFHDAHQIEITQKGKTQLVKGSTIVINTGCRPSTPPIKGIENIPYLDSTSIMHLEKVPEHLIIIGSSYIALEFGQLFKRLGSKVTLLARSERILTREDETMAKALQEILKEEGVDFLFNTSVHQVSKIQDGQIEVDFSSKEDKKTLQGSHLLVAIGREPNTEDLNLKNIGLEIDKKGYIQTDEKLRTSISHIYAIGDVKGGPAFTHISYDDFRIIKANVLEGKNETIEHRLVPYTVFTDPQLGRIGLSESQAKEKNIPYRIAEIPMSYVARAIEIDEKKGLMQALVHKKTEEILGCAILGTEGGELMSMLQIAMMGKLPYQKLAEGIFAHPTLAEGFNTLFNSFKD